MTDRDDAVDRVRDATDPRTIRSVAVRVDDVVTALEARIRSDRETVLRVTPPFSGRMRARLHVVGRADSPGESEVDPVLLAPARLVDGVPPYPTVDATEDALRERGEYSPSAHREAHADAVERWRATVRERIVDAVTLRVDRDRHEIEVKRLG